MDPNSQPQQNMASYFEDTQLDPGKQTFGRKIKQMWVAFQYYARQIWPYIYRLINFLVYEIIKVLRGIVRMALQQFGLFK